MQMMEENPKSTQDDPMTRYVVKISTEIGNCLGVATGCHILTCAHLRKWCVDRLAATTLDAVSDYWDDPVESYIQTLDCCMDFIVLGDSPLRICIEDGDAPATSFEEIVPHLIPSRLVFPNGVDEACIPGFFFAPDGHTRIDCMLSVSRGSPNISMEACESLPGCSGGPIFTTENHLIGILQGALHPWGAEGVQSAESSSGTRIDMAATGWFVEEIGGLRECRLPKKNDSTV